MRWSVLACLMAVAVPAAAADKITKETLGSGGKSRTFYLYVPEGLSPDRPAPLIVFLHGSGRNGQILLESWKGLAKKEGIILAGPDSTNPREWNTLVDPPELLRDVVDVVTANHRVDPRRVYLFGHSAGAIHGLMVGLLESQYFAAVAVHAGLLPADSYIYADVAVRKVPLGIWIGTNDRLFPLDMVRASRDALVQRGFTVALTEIAGHTHDYYGRAGEINKGAWEFLKQHALTADPVFQHYEIR